MVVATRGFSALQRAENSSIDRRSLTRARRWDVSVLFSEPKIPQFVRRGGLRQRKPRFSALQRAENSSICSKRERSASVGRCFSALQRAENSSIAGGAVGGCGLRSFSALQRAENSSIRNAASARAPRALFQCSSASRKFLNCGRSTIWST